MSRHGTWAHVGERVTKQFRVGEQARGLRAGGEGSKDGSTKVERMGKIFNCGRGEGREGQEGLDCTLA